MGKTTRYEYMSKNLKGAGPLLMILGIMLITMILIIFSATLYTKLYIKSIKQQVSVDVQSDARGTWALSFLKSENGGKSNIEVLGSTEAGSYQDFLKDNLKSIDDLIKKSKDLDKAGRQVVLKNRIKIGNSDSENKVLIDIPLPGGEKYPLQITEK